MKRTILPLFLLVSIFTYGQKKSSSIDVNELKAQSDSTINSLKLEDVYTIVEEMPEFPGGNQEMNVYLVKNLKYPEKAMKAKVQGNVYLTFVVNKTGKVEDIYVLRGLDYGCDDEAIRVVREMPNWTPGKQKGIPVNVQYTLPIRFELP